MESSDPGGLGESAPQFSPDVAATEAEICREILAIQRDSYGHGAANVSAHLLDDTVVVILDGLELAPSEEFLISDGQPDAVITIRNQFQQSIAPTFKAAVERATGRRVIGVASQQQLDEPRFAVEVFRLETA
jgi:uncharacterized protein YbcI